MTSRWPISASSCYLDDGDGQFDATQDLLVETAVTNDDGLYRFQAVRPGLHFVAELPDERFVQTAGGDQFPEVPHYSVTMISYGEFLGLRFCQLQGAATGRQEGD